MSGRPLKNALESYVHTEAFLKECIIQAQRIAPGPCTGSAGSAGSGPDLSSLWEEDSDDSSSVTSEEDAAEEPKHAVSKLEAYFYHFGIRGKRRMGPKLIFRTSTDAFVPPSGPEDSDPRAMKVLPVDFHAKLGQNNLWATIRDSEIVQHFKKRRIWFTSVDLVRFSWEEVTDDGDIKVVVTPVTIWIGVLPGSLNGDGAFESSRDILQVLRTHSIHDVDIVYRESIVELLAGPSLYAPVDDFHSLKDVVDPLTTTLSLPIARLDTPGSGGTLGFYFRVGEELYGVTARHVLFSHNEEYTYHKSSPKYKVVLMGNDAFRNLLWSIQARIVNLTNSIDIFERKIESLRRKANGGDEQAAKYLVVTETELERRKEQIKDLKTVYVKVKKDWSSLKGRTIGYIDWAPSIDALPPHRYTRDVCVIKLYKKRFMPSFMGNTLDLGPEIDPGDFTSRMHSRADTQPEFQYPNDRLFGLSPSKINQPNAQDHSDNFVIKRGLATRTTIGHSTKFESYTRRYCPTGDPLDSIEAPIYAFDNTSGPFSGRGDSGSLVVGPRGEFVSLLTGGAGPPECSDITYSTPMHWLWEDVIKPQYPGACLDFEVLDA